MRRIREWIAMLGISTCLLTVTAQGVVAYAAPEPTYEYTEETECQVLEFLAHPCVKGLTLCGGEPMEQENQRALVSLLRKAKRVFPTKDIWLWTGYEFEDLLPCGIKHCEVTDEILSLVDVAVVGPFVLEERDISDNNRWRGSRNQRVIDVPASLKKHKRVYYGFFNIFFFIQRRGYLWRKNLRSCRSILRSLLTVMADGQRKEALQDQWGIRLDLIDLRKLLKNVSMSIIFLLLVSMRSLLRIGIDHRTKWII